MFFCVSFLYSVWAPSTLWLSSLNIFFFFLKNIFFLIYLFLSVLGPRFRARAPSSCSKRGPLFIAVRGPLTIAASPVAEHRLQTRRLSSCGSWAQLLRGMWDLPGPGLEPVSPALAGRLPTAAPPGKPFPKYWSLSHFSHTKYTPVGQIIRITENLHINQGQVEQESAGYHWYAYLMNKNSKVVLTVQVQEIWLGIDWNPASHKHFPLFV